MGSIGWLFDGSENTEFSHILMAIRAGWMGKRCASLYPHCESPQRIVWSLRPDSGWDASTTSISTSTVQPTSTEKVSFEFIQSKVSDVGSEENYDSSEQQQVSKSSASEESEESEESQESEKKQDLSDEVQSQNWGKPSRLAVSDDIALSDIVRGIYQEDSQKVHPNEYDDQSEEESQEEEDEEDSGESDDQEEPIDDSNQNLRQVESMRPEKTERLILMPQNDNYSWAASPLWTTQSGSSQDENQLKLEGGGRRRDRTPFTHADAVKDDRFNEMIMLYLRDRSSK